MSSGSRQADEAAYLRSADETSIAAAQLNDRSPKTELPLTTIIIVNYNYGHYLEDSVESVFGQTYSNIECIVVDNASTDNSLLVLEVLKERHPGLIIIQRAVNDGQTPASLAGLASSSGHYVIFVDADDYLLPKCVETHIYVHLSMRRHIGFTSGDMIQVVRNQVVLSTGEASNRFLRSGKGAFSHFVRPYTGEQGWPSLSVKEDIVKKIRYVSPLSLHWVWSPTSGICYRRDALMMFADNVQLQTLRTCTDLYFALGCSGVSGSVVIDEPLFAYRIHGGNSFTARAQLDGTLNYAMGGQGDNNVKAKFFLIDHLTERALWFTPHVWRRISLVILLLKLDDADRNSELPAWAQRSRAAHAIVRNYDTFAKVVSRFGARFVLACFSGTLRSPRSLLASLRTKR